MIIVHHLDDSRSQRILWLQEELDLPYEIRQHTSEIQRVAWHRPSSSGFTRSANHR
jgi:hypothetical protein